MSQASRLSGWLGVAVVASGLALGAPPAAAIVTSGSSDAFGISVNLTLGGLPLTVPATPVAAGTAPAPYNDSQMVVDFAVGVPGTATLAADALSAMASSDVDGVSSPAFALGSSSVENFDAGLFGEGSTVTFHADSITASAQIAGRFGALVESGSVLLQGAELTLFGNTTELDANPAPNTVLIDTASIDVIVNEQFVGGDGISSRMLEVNAVHVVFTNFFTPNGLLNGDIVVSHSESALTAVPEPAAPGLLALGFVGLRRRRD